MSAAAAWLEVLPDAWQPIIGADYRERMERAERIPAGTGRQSDAQRDATVWLRKLAETYRNASPCGLHLQSSDDDIQVVAAEQVSALYDHLARAAKYSPDMSTIRAALEQHCTRRDIPPPEPNIGDEGAVRRMLSPEWWVRKLRVLHGRGLEGSAIGLGLVRKGDRRAQMYASDITVHRRRRQRERNATTLAATEAENQHGEIFTLAELAAKSTANPEIRRGELMLRIRGFEDYAAAEGHIGEFWTLTAPSRMHRYVHTGELNPNWTEASPKESAEWMGKAWAQFRAAMHRRGLRFYGFRMVEPHHDATPHWHLVLFMPAAHKARARALVRRYFMGTLAAEALTKAPPARRVKADQCGPNMPEEEAKRRRHAYKVERRRLERADADRIAYGCKFKEIQPGEGGAAAYAAGYVSKNIDGGSQGKDLLEDDIITNAQRVEAWKATWSIRQFQQLGGAPVGVWRELRRLPAGDYSPALAAARHATGTKGAEDPNAKPDFCRYLRAMGGALVKRADLPVTLAKTPEGQGIDATEAGKYRFFPKETQYGDPAPGQVFGLVEVCAGRHHVTRVNRWEVRKTPDAIKRERAAKQGAAAQPRTCVNNCTPPAPRNGFEYRHKAGEPPPEGRKAPLRSGFKPWHEGGPPKEKSEYPSEPSPISA